MNIVCLDMESVLTPEIWIAFSEASGIPELRRTTRDEPDYDKLMRWRIATLKEHGLGLKEVQAVIATIDPLEGAPEFIAKLREHVQCVILSDTFEEFASPLVRKLGYPSILCNSLEVSPTGEILSHKMRISHSKLSAVRAFQSINYETIAVGDSYNDLEMLNASKKGFLFHASDKMKAENPNLIPIDDFDSLYEAIMQSL
ncbi:MAG: bifunctional phosphoserine phosphatase/homoserine phosphotransferase ThrH [Oscillospiraceae bacterium]|nr:bifunctional phosphoserine phosphatase/homoserine phosphotransferase ThrH [Oscillospiraceae bacterium]